MGPIIFAVINLTNGTNSNAFRNQNSASACHHAGHHAVQLNHLLLGREDSIPGNKSKFISIHIHCTYLLMT